MKRPARTNLNLPAAIRLHQSGGLMMPGCELIIVDCIVIVYGLFPTKPEVLGRKGTWCNTHLKGFQK